MATTTTTTYAKTTTDGYRIRAFTKLRTALLRLKSLRGKKPLIRVFHSSFSLSPCQLFGLFRAKYETLYRNTYLHVYVRYRTLLRKRKISRSEVLHSFIFEEFRSDLLLSVRFGACNRICSFEVTFPPGSNPLPIHVYYVLPA